MADDALVRGRPSPLPSRMPGLDLVKALCIVGVVLIHATPDHSSAFGRYVIEGAARLAVPCFLSVTGFLAGRKGTSSARFREYLLVFIRLHILYGLLYAFLTVASRGLPDPLTLKFVVLRFGEAAYPGQFYFVVLIQLFLFTSLLPARIAWRSAAWVWGSAAVAAAGLCLLVAAPEITGALELPRGASRILGTPNGLWLWFYYFALGAYVGAAPEMRRTSSSTLAGIGVLAGIVIATLGLPRLPDWEGQLRLSYTYARVPVYVGATLIVLALPRLAELPAWGPLARIGRDSFGIFVWNPAVLMLLSMAFGVPGSVADSCLRALVTVAVCAVITAQLRRHAAWALP